MRKIFIAGNWKMNGSCSLALQYARDFWPAEDRDLVIAVAAPFTQLAALKEGMDGSGVLIFAQNMFYEDSGAYTGEISALMLKEIGTDGVIIGHSERRQYFGETDETVLLKTKKALKSGLMPIVCVGEDLSERDAGRHFDKVKAQVASLFSGISEEDALKITVAYEPIWAIGTGRTASPLQAQEMCAFIRETVKEISGDKAAEKLTVQYGGSVKPENIGAIMAMKDIDGALVGGASLDPGSFTAIIREALKAKKGAARGK